MRSHRGLTLLELLVIIVIVAILASLVIPVRSSARESAKRTSCASNLNQIAKAMYMYADVPANAVFPCASRDPDTSDPMVSLGLLYNNYVADPRVFSCPSKPIPPATLAALVPNGRVMSSYGYDPAHGPNDAVAAIAADWKVAGENSDNHGANTGQNVLMGAGTIEFMEKASREIPGAEGQPPLHESDIFKRDPELPRAIDGVIRQ